MIASASMDAGVSWIYLMITTIWLKLKLETDFIILEGYLMTLSNYDTLAHTGLV